MASAGVPCARISGLLCFASLAAWPVAGWAERPAPPAAPPVIIEQGPIIIQGAAIGGAVVQIQNGFIEVGDVVPANASDDKEPQPRLSESHPDIFKKLVDFRVGQQVGQFNDQARHAITAWRAGQSLSADAAETLTQAAATSITALKEEIRKDFGSFLDQVFTPANMALHGQTADEVLEMILEGLESDEGDFFFYRTPASLSLEHHDGWVEAVREALPDEQAFLDWRARIEEAKDEAEKAEGLFLAEAGEQAKMEASQSMAHQLERLFELAEFDEPAQESITSQAETVVDEAVGEWTERLHYFVQRTDPDIWEFLVETVAAPVGGDLWDERLAEGFSAEQRDAWVQVLREGDDEDMRLFEARLEAVSANYESHFRNVIKESLDEVLLVMDLEPEQEEKFTEASEEAVQGALEDWKTRARQWLNSLEGEAREQALRRGSVSVSVDRETVQQQPAWRGSFESILTDEQQKQWAETQSAFEEQREAATARLVLLTIDQGIGLTPDQWQRMEELVRAQDTRNIVQTFRQTHFHLNPHLIGGLLRGLDEAELREILTDSQWSRWREYVSIIEDPHRARRSINFDPGADDPSMDDELALEGIISRFIHERSSAERNRVLMELMAEVDYLRMTADLPETVIRRLETAAKGAAEEIIDEWSDNFTRTVRERMRRVQRQLWRNQIASLAGFQFSHRDPADSRVWKGMLTRIEQSGQGEERAEALLQREHLHASAIADLVVLHAASRLGLSPERWPRLHEAVLEALGTYRPDFEAALGRSNTQWFLRNPGILMPVAAVPEDKLREILTERQYRRWRDEVGTSTTGYWSRVESMHRQRTQRE